MKRDSVDNRRPGERAEDASGAEGGAPASRQGGHEQILHAFGELEASFSGLKKMQLEAARHEAELAERAEQLDRERAELESRLGGMSRERAKLAEERDQLQRERAEMVADGETLKTKWREVTKALEQAEHQAKTTREGSARDVSGLQAKLAEANTQVSNLKAECTQLRSQVEEASTEQKKSKDALKSAPSKDQVAKYEKAIDALTEKLDEANARTHFLQEEIDTLKSRPAARSRSASGPESGHMALRRERLKRYRKLLQAQGGKIVQAQNALTKRHAECDQVMAQRGRLSVALVELQRREAKISGFKARTAATIILFYTVVTLGVLAFVSWAAAGKVKPATYAARAIVEADSRGRTLSPEELKGWQQYHEQLLEDPALMETAAERMDRRGIIELGKAPQLRDKVLKDLYVQNTIPGKLMIELRGQGAGRTTVILDTYINAMVSTANSSRGTRTDGVSTLISQVAKPDGEPLADGRMPYALGMFGGASVLVLLVSAVFGGRLARAKRKHDAPEPVPDALEDEAWKGNDQVGGVWNTDSTKPIGKKRK